MPFVLTNTAAAPAMVHPVAGDGQWRLVGMPFSQPLTVEVRDEFGNRVTDAPVVFEAPMSGPTMEMMTDASTLTDDEGRAAVFVRAGIVPGTYIVTAHVTGAPSAQFRLSNVTADDMLPDGWRGADSLAAEAAKAFGR
jgi:hypothetical protein